MIQTAVFPGRYVQGEGALDRLGEELSRFGQKAFFIAGNTAQRDPVSAHRQAWQQHVEVEVEPFGGECSSSEIDRLTRRVGEKQADVVVGMGGGKALDAAKAVAHRADCRAAIVPTIASTDAPCSAVSVLYTQAGEFERYLFLPRNPELVLVDTSIIARAPVRFLVAGMGDALATWFEADACRRSRAPNQCGGLATLAGFSLARLCYDTLLEYGVSAKFACEAGVVTPALEHIVEANTLLSGLGFECGGLAAAHSIHNGFTVLPQSHQSYHGEKVAFGVLAGLFLQDRSSQLIHQVYGFCEAVGLPTRLADLGLGSVTDAELLRVAERACAEGETIHHEAAPASPREVFAAIKTADAVGFDRQSRVVAGVR